MLSKGKYGDTPVPILLVPMAVQFGTRSGTVLARWILIHILTFFRKCGSRFRAR